MPSPKAIRIMRAAVALYISQCDKPSKRGDGLGMRLSRRAAAVNKKGRLVYDASMSSVQGVEFRQPEGKFARFQGYLQPALGTWDQSSSG
jgi:hypothetical protein